MVAPGQLTCLMGASGAGKTTLLDVVAGRKTQGVIEGEIRLNGWPKQDNVWRRVSAYVEQQDIHTETVRRWRRWCWRAGGLRVRRGANAAALTCCSAR